MKKIVLLCILCCLSLTAFCASDSGSSLPPRLERDISANVTGPKVFFRPKVDFAIIVPATVWTIYAFPKIYSKDNIDSATLAGLKKESIPAFDRWAVRHSEEAATASDYFFYSSIPYPIVLMADKDLRHDAARVYGLYWEAMAITGLLYTGGDYFIDRYRPETYDETKEFGDRQSGNEKNAFFAGHVALVSTATFFTASMYDQYHPTSKLKWAFYGVATAATGATAYLRHRAGKHFPSDILVGAIVGVGSGMLVPRLHRNKAVKKTSWHFSPYASPMTGEGYGMAATWRF